MPRAPGMGGRPRWKRWRGWRVCSPGITPASSATKSGDAGRGRAPNRALSATGKTPAARRSTTSLTIYPGPPATWRPCTEPAWPAMRRKPRESPVRIYRTAPPAMSLSPLESSGYGPWRRGGNGTETWLISRRRGSTAGAVGPSCARPRRSTPSASISRKMSLRNSR